jgi:hypothetical protein
VRIFEQVHEVGKDARIAHPSQGCRPSLAQPAVRIAQGGCQGYDRLVIIDLLKPFDCGAAHLGIFVAKAREQKLEPAWFPGGVHVFEGFAARGCLTSVVACSTTP